MDSNPLGSFNKALEKRKEEREDPHPSPLPGGRGDKIRAIIEPDLAVF